MLTHDFVVVSHTATIGDTFYALVDAGADMNWYVIVAYPDHYGAVRAGQLAKQALAGRNASAALQTSLCDLNVSSVEYVLDTLPTGPSEVYPLALVLEQARPSVLLYRATRSFDSKAGPAFDTLVQAMNALTQHASIPPKGIDFGDISFSLMPVPESSPPIPEPTTRGPETPQRTTDVRARYVNTWFTDRIDGQPFSSDRGLVRSKPYWLQLHIGPLLEESIIVAPRPIDPDLPPIPDEGLLLRVKLFSHDFEIENDTHELRLFATGATERLHIALTAPDTVGEARLRAGIYYQNNLVQSFLFHAWVDEYEWSGRGNRAIWAEVEYSLSEDLADITQLQPRRVNIFVNDSPDGTHMVGVVGTPTEGALSVGRDKMKEAVTEFRARLLTIVMDEQQKYRYGPDNAGGKDQFVDDLKTLAYLGNALFRSVFYRDETIDFTRDLRQALAGAQPAVIQVARLSSDFVFPWAGIYDQRLTVDREKNQVCLKPLQQATPAAALDTCNACLQRHGQDPNTICLSGFWGFRHIVEQPLSVVREGQPTSIVREIKASGAPAASMNVYTGNDFKLRSGHQAWIDALIQQKAGKLIFSDKLEHVKRGLPQPQQLCYFYCHGGSSPKSLNPWLTVGQDERFMPPDLYGMALEEGWRFQNVRPLVLINACHSIEFTPEALSAFLPEFATAGASGIIGTEVSVFEPLAVEFGQGLIQAFLDGEPIGPAVQGLRWQLLLKYNVLGLVYTPYCYADLCLVSDSA